MPRPRSRVRFQAGSSSPRAMPRAVPSVDPWTAAEMFVSPHVEERRRGFAILCGSEAGRRSPLTPHLLASRITESDLSLRAQIVHALGDYFEVRGRLYRYPPELRAAVVSALRQFERSQVLAVLEVMHAARARALNLRSESVIRVLERVPEAASVLARVAGDRSLSLPLRQAAVEAIGLVGFTDARPALEGLRARIEGRAAGQLTMLFAPSDWPDEEALVPALKETLALLDERD